MEALRAWDGEMLITNFDRPTGAWIVIAVHSTRLGPATGGTRMRSYPGLAAAVEDALRLAEGMTLKFAVTGFPRGGGKAVIAIPDGLDTEERRGLLKRYGALIHKLNGLYYTGPDIGTGPFDMDVIAETGAPFVHSRTLESGGAGDSAPATAVGTFEGIRTTWERVSGSLSLAGVRVVVQGAGSVGSRVISLLQHAGAHVRFADAAPQTAARMSEATGCSSLPLEMIYAEPCDIFSPCAVGGVLNEETIPLLRCRAVAGCANNQLSKPEDAEMLRSRGILYAPDFVVSLGGAMAITGIEAMGWSAEEAIEGVVETITSALRRMFEVAEGEGITTVEAARRIAQERLEAPV